VRRTAVHDVAAAVNVDVQVVADRKPDVAAPVDPNVRGANLQAVEMAVAGTGAFVGQLVGLADTVKSPEPRIASNRLPP